MSAIATTTTGVSEATATEGTGATSSATALETAATVPGCVPQCSKANLIRPGPLAVGQYKTVIFFAGALKATVEEGWGSNEDSATEFELHNADGVQIVVWLDVYPLKHCPTPGCSLRVEDVGTGAAALAEWLRGNPNLTVKEAEPLTLDGIPFDSLNIASADDAISDDPHGCPSKPCVDVLGFPGWDTPFGIAHDSHWSLHLADVEYGGKNHLLVIATDGPGTFKTIAQRTEPVLKTFDIPAAASGPI